MPVCKGCLQPFGWSAYANHQTQTSNPACVAEFQKLNALMPGLLDEVPAQGAGDEQADEGMDIDGPGANDDDDDDAPDIEFGGAFFDGELNDGDFVGFDPEGQAIESGGEEDEDKEDDDDDDDGDEEEGDGGDDPLDYEDARPWEAAPEPPLVPPPPAEAPAPPPLSTAPGRQNIEDALRQDVHIVPFTHATSDRAGKPIRRDNAAFTSYHNDKSGGVPNNPYAPFPSKRDWEIAHWAKMRGPTSTALNELLKIEGVRA